MPLPHQVTWVLLQNHLINTTPWDLNECRECWWQVTQGLSGFCGWELACWRRKIHVVILSYKHHSDEGAQTWSREGLAHLQTVSESSLIHNNGKLTLFPLRSLIRGTCPKRGFDSLICAMEIGNLHWMGRGGWLNLRLSHQAGRECSPLLSHSTFPKGKQPGPSRRLLIWFTEGGTMQMRRAY